MSWRTVVIRNHCKLDLKLNQMIVRGEETVKINLSEISVLIVENTAVSITACLLSELVSRKITVIFCDEKRNPQFELSALYGCHNSSGRIKEQMLWKEEHQTAVWTEIVKNKILQQANVLDAIDQTRALQLKEYSKEVCVGDSTNREGHAAKVYFNGLFGLEFTRNEESAINSCLNYGYAVLLSLVNREIVSNGYLTQLGIFHDNAQNPFNLGSDLMEPFRPCIDRQVFQLNPKRFGPEEKNEILKVLTSQVVIDGKKQFFTNAVKIYCSSVFDAINTGDPTLIQFYTYEL
ncbi:MAG: type II CRISPR-associated endonuclease Cas1 [Veillonella sp.]|nr:type II CRISPR-associated endonuclease Cas1 [Veillonella sp.]